ncbi:eCIS core domain-containing protein [Pseudomonas akapageensis]|uniref:eCIS core domain-containing protein n=1 Tax=Pseudomonas akapageensis TaxID=2609961 RepID=UPI001408CD14|nr:DUF4157 domain-containing protein [Pseudomonas akapageensis]
MLALEHKKSTSHARASAREEQQRHTLPLSTSPTVQLARACTCGGSCPRCQAKSAIKIGAPDDAYEREAEAVADRVMRMSDGARRVTPAASGLQRKCTDCENQSEVPRLQAEAECSSTSAPTAYSTMSAPPSVDAVLRSPGQALSSETRAFLEPRFGWNFATVQVHSDLAAQQSAKDVNAQAYTLGHHIVFGAGQFAPETSEGRRLIAHELTHVVQQSEPAPLTNDSPTGSSATVTQRSPTPEIMRSSLFNSTMRICHSMLESRRFAITEGGLKVTTFARWQPNEEWQGTEAELQCGRPEFNITLVRDDPIFDNEFGTCTFPMGLPTSSGIPFSQQWTGLSENDDWYLEIWPLNSTPNCCMDGNIEVEQARGLSGDSCTKPPPGPLETLHDALDVAGMLPALGAFPDAINAGIYAIEGDWGNAGLSALAAIPIFGDTTKGASLIYKGGKEAVQVSGDAVRRAGKDKIVKGLNEARAVSQSRAAAAVEAKTMQKELGASTQSAEKELVGTDFVEGPAKATRPGRPPNTGLGKTARQEFEKVRDDYAKRLGVPSSGQVHHAIELQALDRYPGVFTSKELNAFENARGIGTEVAGKRQLHQSKIREVWDRHYARIDKEIAAKGLKPGTAKYNEHVKKNLQEARDELDYVLGQFFTEYRTGKPRSFK